GHRRAGDHHPRNRPPQRAGPDHAGGSQASRRVDRQSGRPHQRDRPAQHPDEGRAVTLPVRADEAASDGLPGRGRGLTWRPAVDRRLAGRPLARHEHGSPARSAGRRPAPRASRARKPSALDGLTARLTPDVVRSIIGLTLLVLGAMTLIAPTPPGEGALTSWWTGVFSPWFGTMRWVAPFLLLLAGWWLEWGPGTRPGSGWGITLLGILITYAGIAGAAQVLGVSGGRIGRGLASTLTDLFSAPGAFVLLIALAILGVIIGFGIPLRQLARPAVGTARWMGSTAAASLKR